MKKGEGGGGARQNGPAMRPWDNLISNLFRKRCLVGRLDALLTSHDMIANKGFAPETLLYDFL